MSKDPQSKTAFISGPVEFPDGFFTEYYEPRLTEAISSGHFFIMGPAPGIDSISLEYLIKHGVKPPNITVYFSEFEEKTLAERIQWLVDLGGNVKVEGVTNGDRDAAMTRDSDYDILEYMSIEEQQEFYGERYYPRVSATEKNDRRRKGLPLHVNHGLDSGYYEAKRRKNVAEDANEGSSTVWPRRIRKFFNRFSDKHDDK